MTTLDSLIIKTTDRAADHTGSIKITRRMNAVGEAEFFLDNQDGTYDEADFFNVEHDLVQITVDEGIIFYGHLYRVLDVIGCNPKARWVKLKKLIAKDQAEELTFQDDFEKTYNAQGQTIDDVVDDIFNHAGLEWNHINYIGGQAGTAALGTFEKKKGQSLVTFLQEVHRSVDQVFLVNDSGAFKSYPLVNLPSSGVTLDRTKLIGDLEFVRQDAAKLYNYIELTGKAPMFDAYTERTASSLEADGQEDHLSDDDTDKMVGQYSVLFDNTVHHEAAPGIQLVAPVFNYDTFDLTKGPLSAWFKYTGAAAELTRAVRFQLKDGTNTINFYSGDVSLAIYSSINQTKIVKDRWCYVEAPVGKDPTTSVDYCDQWWPTPGAGEFAWENVTEIGLSYESKDLHGGSGDIPDNIRIDGLVLPFAPKALAIKAGHPPWGTLTHRRPLITTRADLRTQIALQEAADTMLAQHQDAQIDEMKGLFMGEAGLRYAGYEYTANFDVDVTNLPFYAQEVTHIINPRGDAGRGHSWTTYVNGVYAFLRAWDHGRLGGAPIASYSIPGIGLREK